MERLDHLRRPAAAGVLKCFGQRPLGATAAASQRVDGGRRLCERCIGGHGIAIGAKGGSKADERARVVREQDQGPLEPRNRIPGNAPLTR